MKRIPELRDLSDDHHTGLALARHCKLAGRADSELSPESVWERVLDTFSIHLEPHFQIEEIHLLPALEAIGEALLAKQVRDEHLAIRALLDSESVTRELVERFGELLESHIRFEERQVFEPTQHRLPPHALEAIEAGCKAISRACPVFLQE